MAISTGLHSILPRRVKRLDGRKSRNNRSGPRMDAEERGLEQRELTGARTAPGARGTRVFSSRRLTSLVPICETEPCGRCASGG